MPKKAKSKGNNLAVNVTLAMATVQSWDRSAVLIATYSASTSIRKSAAVSTAKSQEAAAVYGRMVKPEPDMQISKNEMVRLY